MIRQTFFALLICLPAFAAEAPSATAPTNLVTIDIAPGVNTIPGFTPDNRPAHVLRAWRENGNAHGYSVYVVTSASGVGTGAWNIVPIIVPTPWQVRDTLTDAPHAFEDVVRSVRFARGRIGPANDGADAETVLLIATRQAGASIPDPSLVDFELYRVVVTDEMGDVLERVRAWRSTRTYCNADMALLREVGLVLPRDYQGGQNEDGCL